MAEWIPGNNILVPDFGHRIKDSPATFKSAKITKSPTFTAGDFVHAFYLIMLQQVLHQLQQQELLLQEQRQELQLSLRKQEFF